MRTPGQANLWLQQETLTVILGYVNTLIIFGGGGGGERWKGRGRTKKKKLEREVMGSKSAKHQNLRKISKFYFVKY